uniref:Transcriptional repressor TUP1 n=1 Tax=Ganoderma boninense TaxID=34458 RepID=A0A5K1JYF9_9APHY|nr:Transcriptional repressor TUP1 [Ganoderma boninense]
MVLQVLYTAATTVLPFNYWPHAALAAAVFVVIYAYTQGRSTTRERDLHARVVILTGPFTPLGLVALTALAKRGASIIALSPYPLSHPVPSLILPLLRTTTKNDNIFAEHCDLTSATSIRKFCTSFLTQNDTRIDALIFAHEYPSIGRIWFFGGNARKDKEQREAEQRESASLASFLLTTLLLPALLVAPVERDIRVVSVVNPFYAAALPTFPTFLTSTPATPLRSIQPIVIAEGHRALRTIVVTRHLQRILDSLPNRKSEEKPDANKPPAPHPSNILAVSACPGISRRDTVAPLLGTGERGWSLAYMVLFLPLLLLTKTSESALQTVLHCLFLPTPLKRAQFKVDAAADDEVRKAQAQVQAAPAGGAESGRARGPARIANVEVLKPGALYRECAVVQFDVPKPAVPLPEPKESKGGKEKSTVESILEDDGEFGGEAVGRAVWEWYEVRLKEWEARDKERVQEEEAAAREAAAETEEGESAATRDGEASPETETQTTGS